MHKSRDEAGYDSWARAEERRYQPPPPHQEQEPPVRALAHREVARRRLFDMARPDVILGPVNVVAVYLGSHPMWPSWSWADTQGINARMLPFVQELDPDDPVVDDPRVALPMTVAGAMLHHALWLDARGEPLDGPAVLMDVYRELASGISFVDRLVTDVVKAKLSGDLTEAFCGDFYHIGDVATGLLMRAGSFGPETFGLIVPCVLGAECRLQAPYFVNPPGQKLHGACRAYLSRRKAEERVTPRRRKGPK